MIKLEARNCVDIPHLLSVTTVLVARTSPSDNNRDANGKYILITVSMKEFLATLIASYIGSDWFKQGSTLVNMFKTVTGMTKLLRAITNGWSLLFPSFNCLWSNQLHNFNILDQTLDQCLPERYNPTTANDIEHVFFDSTLVFGVFFNPQDCEKHVLASTMNTKYGGGLHDLYNSAFSGSDRLQSFIPYNVNAAAGGSVMDGDYVYCWVGNALSNFDYKLGVYANHCGGLITMAVLASPTFPMKEWTFTKTRPYGVRTDMLYKMLCNFVVGQSDHSTPLTKQLIELFLVNFAARAPVLVGGPTRPYVVPLHVLHEYVRNVGIVDTHEVARCIDPERNSQFIVRAAEQMLICGSVNIRFNVIDETVDFFGIALDFTEILRSVVSGVGLAKPGPLAGAIRLEQQIMACRRSLMKEYEKTDPGGITHVNVGHAECDTKTTETDFGKHAASSCKMLGLGSWHQLIGSIPGITTMLVMQGVNSTERWRIPIAQIVDVTPDGFLFKKPLEHLILMIVGFDLGFQKDSSTRIVSLSGITPPIASHHLPDDYAPGYTKDRVPPHALYVSEMYYAIFAEASGASPFTNMKAAFCFDELYYQLVVEENAESLSSEKEFALNLYDVRSAHQRTGVSYDGIKVFDVSKPVKEWLECLKMVEAHLRLLKHSELDDMSHLTFGSLHRLATLHGGGATKSHKRKADNNPASERSRGSVNKSQVILNAMFFFLRSDTVKSKVLKSATETYAHTFPVGQQIAPLVCYGLLALSTDTLTISKLAQTSQVGQGAASLDCIKFFLNSHLPKVFALCADTMQITEINCAERFATVRMIIDNQCRPFIDLKGLHVKNGTQEWFVGPLRLSGKSKHQLFSYYMIDNANRRGLVIFSYVSFEVSVTGLAIVSGFARNKNGATIVPGSWKQAASDDWTRLLGYRSEVPFLQFADVGIQQFTFMAPFEYNDMRACDISIVDFFVNMAPEVLLEMFHYQVVNGAGKHLQPTDCYIGNVRQLGFQPAQVHQIITNTETLRKQTKVYEDGAIKQIPSNPMLHNVAADWMEALDFFGQVLQRVIMPVVCADPAAIHKGAAGVSTSIGFLLFSIFDDVKAPSFETKRLNNGKTGELSVFTLDKGKKLTSSIYNNIKVSQVSAQHYLSSVSRTGAWPAMTEALTVQKSPSGEYVKFINSASATLIDSRPVSLVRLLCEQTQCYSFSNGKSKLIPGKSYMNQLFCMQTKKHEDLNTSKIGMFAFQAATLERLRVLKLTMSDLLQNKLTEMRRNAELKQYRNQVRTLEDRITSLHAMPQTVNTSPSTAFSSPPPRNQRNQDTSPGCFSQFESPKGW